MVHAFELPSIDDTLLSAPRLTIAATGTGEGWRSAALQLSLDGGARWTPIGQTAGRATIGTLLTAPGTAPSTLVDRRHAFDVVLADTDASLADADDAALDRGANLALVGDELLQFGRAEPIAPGRWRLSRLWRGRRGTEWAAGGATAGSCFVLLDPATLTHVSLPVGAIGGAASVLAAGVGDGDTPAMATATLDGRSVSPPSPVHMTAHHEPDGTLRIDWVRRSRAGWHWIDRVDAALIEEAERYAIDVGDAQAVVTEPAFARAAGSWSSDDAATVRQIGSFAASQPTRLECNRWRMDE